MITKYEESGTFELTPWDTGLQDVPPRLDQIAPGPVLAAYLSLLDVNQLSGNDRVLVLRAHQRMVRHYQAHTYRDIAAIRDALEPLDASSDQPGLAAEAEIQAALTWTRRHTEFEAGLAIDLADRYPAVLRALSSGDLDTRQARVLVDETLHLDHSAASDVVGEALPDSPNMTTGELRAHVRRLSFAVDPNKAAERFEKAKATRRVEVRPTPQGTAGVLGLDLSPEDAQAISRRIHHLSRATRTADDDRTADQVKADVFVDLLLGQLPDDAKRPAGGSIDLRVDLTTLAGLDDNPAHLGGFGPVIADVARKVATQNTDASWRFTVTDPDTGEVSHTGTTRRRPTAAQTRMVTARHPQCIFPGCRMPSIDSDIDHTKPHSSGGPTEEWNLAPLCRYHHRVKGEAGWTYRKMPDGAVIWTSPLGHRYRKIRPPP